MLLCYALCKDSGKIPILAFNFIFSFTKRNKIFNVVLSLHLSSRKKDEAERNVGVRFQRHAHKFFLLLNELATLKQHFVSRCSTKVETRYNKKNLHALKTFSCGMPTAAA